MNSLEEKIVKKAIENLRESVRTNWNRGDVDKWSEYAKKCVIPSLITPPYLK